MNMKFRAHDTFFIRRGWLSKGMRNVDKKANIFIDKEERPMDVLGMGSNMVKALRYWMQAVGLTSEPPTGPREQNFTDLGDMVFEHDRYIEEMGTLYLLHYKLVSNEELATSWYYFFNEFMMMEFTKEDFVLAIQSYIKKHAKSVAPRSLEDDFNCIINTYLPRYKLNSNKISPESNIDCPFAELGLVDILNKKKKIYKKSAPLVNTIDVWVALAVISDQTKGRFEIPINELLTGKYNVGKIFNLDIINLIQLLQKIERTGKLNLIRAAGLDVIHIDKELTFKKCVDTYYNNIDK